MKVIWSALAALIAGFIGGISGMVVMRTYQPARPEQVVRARSFELVNEAGETVSFWGVDRGQNAVLAFGRRGLAPNGAQPQGSPTGPSDPDNQLVAFGLLGDDGPMLKMRGADGKMRVRLFLTANSKPILLMEDETGPRLSLGIEQSDTPGPQDNDWTLAFFPERSIRTSWSTPTNSETRGARERNPAGTWGTPAWENRVSSAGRRSVAELGRRHPAQN